MTLSECSTCCLTPLLLKLLLGISNLFSRDKRPYEFVERGVDGTSSVKRRIPDATMGLRTYIRSDLDHGYTCDVVDCKINHDSMQPNKTLLESRIRTQMYDRQCGLTVDGIWGESNLIFPFAVYEAKKSYDTWEQAEDQIYHAFKVYLGMLDDLARDPTNVTEYQTEESARYQLFGFTSCGPAWKVYIAWNFLDSCVSNNPKRLVSNSSDERKARGNHLGRQCQRLQSSIRAHLYCRSNPTLRCQSASQVRDQTSRAMDSTRRRTFDAFRSFPRRSS